MQPISSMNWILLRFWYNQFPQNELDDLPLFFFSRKTPQLLSRVLLWENCTFEGYKWKFRFCRGMYVNRWFVQTYKCVKLLSILSSFLRYLVRFLVREISIKERKIHDFLLTTTNIGHFYFAAIAIISARQVMHLITVFQRYISRL